MRRKRVPAFVFPLAVLLLAGLLLAAGISLLLSPERKAKGVVEEFYFHEADGDFSDSWELLHPFMKEKFSKTAYVQDRTHVFIGHFGAETFTYNVGEGKKLEGWSMEKGRSPFGTAYKYHVAQHYKGKYGKFSFQQDVYVTQDEEGKWHILWDYNQ
jgi:hypothetical protein